MMNTPRLFGGIAAALAFSLTASVWAAPHKTTKKHAAPAKHAPTPPVTKKPTPVTATAPVTPAAPSPTPAPGDTILYGGNTIAGAGLTLTAFGGGAGEESTEQSFAKNHSLKVTTLDDYQGATMAFTTPVDLGDTTDKTRYLALTLRLGVTPPSPTQGMMGGGGMMPPGGGMMAPGDGPMGGGFPGQNPNGMGQGMPVAVPTSLQNIHLILTLVNGAQTDLLRPLPSDAQTGQDQWVNVAIPLSALEFAAGGTPSPLKSLTIAGDDYAILFVGQIKLTHDETPITCFAGDQQNVAVGQPLQLKGSASSGLTGLRYSWDFNAADGVTEQASGPTVTTQYQKAGEYKVTLTVSDVDGIKKPAVSTTTIRVQ